MAVNKPDMTQAELACFMLSDEHSGEPSPIFHTSSDTEAAFLSESHIDEY